MNRLLLTLATTIAIAVGASLACVPLMALMFLMPFLVAVQRSRIGAYCVALVYYAAASWPLVPGARNFFGPTPWLLSSLGLWLLSATILACPFALLWTSRRDHVVWRIPMATLINAVPPLGIIGWASPLTSAGLLFPGREWFGVVATTVLPGLLLARPRVTASVAAILVAFSNLAFRGSVQAPADWQAFDTTFGGIAHGESSPVAPFLAAEQIQELATSSNARVVIFPETVVPMWTEATALFWQQTLAELQASGKTIVFGAEIPMVRPAAAPKVSDVAEYRNTILIKGADSGALFQRIPVPVGMWKPFIGAGVPLNLSGNGTIQLGKKRAAILICYEQLLPWPVLQSLAERPSVVVAVANDYWAVNTPIPECQAVTVKAWARLFRLPVVSATNR